MEVTNIQKYIHSTPRKLRLVADMVRKMEPNQAILTLRFTNKAAAMDLKKAIQTAMAGAKEKGMDNVAFKSVEVNEGPRLKRFRAGTKGRVKRYEKRMAHIKIVLSDELRVESSELKSKKSKVKNTSQNEKLETVAVNVIPNASEESLANASSSEMSGNTPDKSEKPKRVRKEKS